MMIGAMNNKDVYNSEWFRERALNSLTKISDGIWDYSDSLLLYIPGTESEYESVQVGDDPYAIHITQPENTYLGSIADRIVEQLPSEFEYVDLGPGTAHKEQFIFDAAKKASKKFTYLPVDINNHYLTLAKDYAEAQSITVTPILSSFENLETALPNTHTPRFVSLGLTFGNYQPLDVLKQLTHIGGVGGYVFIEVQLRDRVDMDIITEIYRDDAPELGNPKLHLIGLNPDTDIASSRTDDGIRIWYTLKNSTSELEAKGINAGDQLLMFQSLRYTKESIEKEIHSTGYDYILLDTDGPFLGIIIKV
jgi:hypothetical protein